MKLDFLSLGGPGRPLPHFDLFADRPAAAPRQLDDAGRIIKVGLIAAGGFLGLLLLFALVAPISGAAVAQGELTTAGTRILIQPPAGGVVAQLLVGEGQRIPGVEIGARMAGGLIVKILLDLVALL